MILRRKTRDALALLLFVLAAANAAAADALLLRYAPDDGVAQLLLSTSGATLVAQDDAHRLLWRYSVDAHAFGAGDTPGAGPCHGAVELTLLHDDLDHDGRIDGHSDGQSGETARLYISSSWSQASPAGSTLTALDVSRPLAPRLLWVLDARALPDLGLLSAAVTPARIRVGASNSDARHHVLVFGAGLPLQSGGTSGRRLYIVDALDGRLLWSAAADGADQRFAAMQAAFAGGVTALDLDGDDYTDRLYVGDLGSSLWRFDVWQGQVARSLLTGGVLAALANAAVPTPRGFRAAPDVALMTRGAATVSSSPAALVADPAWFTIGIGTQAWPDAGTVTDNWYFLVRDRQPFTAWTQARYDEHTPIRMTDLALVGTAAAETADAAAGLRIALGSGQVAAQATTAARVAFYTVVESGAADERFCTTPPPAATPVVAVHAIDADTGESAFDINGDGRRDSADRAQSAAGARPRDSVVVSAGPAATSADTICRVGTTTLAACIRLPPLKATYWRREDAE
jgi:hypothetical protein